MILPKGRIVTPVRMRLGQVLSCLKPTARCKDRFGCQPELVGQTATQPNAHCIHTYQIRCDPCSSLPIWGSGLDASSPLQDAGRISRTSNVKLLEGPDLRTIMLAINQSPSEPFESNIKGKNPLKDVRVRKALYQAIHIEAIKTRIMRGKSRTQDFS